MRFFAVIFAFWAAASLAEDQAASSSEAIVVMPETTEVDGRTPSDLIYTCSHNDLVRRVELTYLGEQRLPCEVNYYKYDEAPGNVQTLWSASNTEGYCEDKTEELVGKLQGWGWRCDVN